MNFKEEVSKINIDLTDAQLKLFDIFYNNLIEVNSYMNLTAITEKEEVYIKHFFDSLLLSLSADFTGSFTLCDVGSGAGFPSIPLSIVYPNVNITIIDALNKRIKFLNQLIKELDLTNVQAFHARAEEFVTGKREYFDIVTARAVAKLNVLSELCLPLTKIGGYFIAMKGQTAMEEYEEAKKGIETLGGKLKEVLSFDLPNGMGKRNIILIQKIKETPLKYPRSFSKIKEKPL